jgi:hypothetical protein
MTRQAIFKGLIVDENDQHVEVVSIGNEPFYVVNDYGFRRHIPSDQVDRQVFAILKDMMDGHENIIADQTAKFLGQEDIFSKAALLRQIQQFGDQVDALLEIGIPEESLAYLGMVGFRIRINLHGDVLDVIQPGIIDSNDDE